MFPVASCDMKRYPPEDGLGQPQNITQLPLDHFNLKKFSNFF